MARNVKPNFPDDEEDLKEAPETPGETPDAEDVAEGPETQDPNESAEPAAEEQGESPDQETEETDQEGGAEAGQDAQSIPGADKLSPDEQDKVRRLALAAQAMIGDKKYSAQLVQMAQKGDGGIVMACLLILETLDRGGRIGKDWAIQAAAVILTVFIDFLVSIKQAQPDSKHFTQLLGALIARVAKQYKIDPRVVAQAVGGAPSGMRPAMNAANARGGMLGQMMGRAGIPGGA